MTVNSDGLHGDNVQVARKGDKGTEYMRRFCAVRLVSGLRHPYTGFSRMERAKLWRKSKLSCKRFPVWRIVVRFACR